MLETLIHTNRILARRTGNRVPRKYLYWIGGVVLLTAVIWGLLITTDWDQLHAASSALLAIVVLTQLMIDAFSVIMRFSAFGMVTPHYLELFPVERRQVALFYLISLLADYKSLVYVVSITACIVLFVPVQMYTVLAAWVFVLGLFYITTNVWFVAVYFGAKRYLRTYRKQVVSIIHIGVLLLYVIVFAEAYDVFLYIPLVNFAATSLGAALQAEHAVLAENVTYLFLALGAGLLVLVIVLRRGEINFIPSRPTAGTNRS